MTYVNEVSIGSSPERQQSVDRKKFTPAKLRQLGATAAAAVGLTVAAVFGVSAHSERSDAQAIAAERSQLASLNGQQLAERVLHEVGACDGIEPGPLKDELDRRDIAVVDDRCVAPDEPDSLVGLFPDKTMKDPTVGSVDTGDIVKVHWLEGEGHSTRNYHNISTNAWALVETADGSMGYAPATWLKFGEKDPTA